MFHKKTEMSMPIIFILLGIAAFAYSMTIPKDDGMFLKIHCSDHDRNICSNLIFHPS